MARAKSTRAFSTGRSDPRRAQAARRDPARATLDPVPWRSTVRGVSVRAGGSGDLPIHRRDPRDRSRSRGKDQDRRLLPGRVGRPRGCVRRVEGVARPGCRLRVIGRADRHRTVAPGSGDLRSPRPRTCSGGEGDLGRRETCHHGDSGRGSAIARDRSERPERAPGLAADWLAARPLFESRLDGPRSRVRAVRRRRGI